MRTRIKGLGTVGLITDPDPHAVPPNGWSTLHNVRCIDGAIEPVVGYATATTGTSALSPSGTTQDLHVHQQAVVTNSSNFYFVFAMDTDDDGDAESLYTWDGDTSNAIVDRTRTTGAYTGAADDLWQMCEFNGLVVATNGVDAPQYWGPLMTDFTYLPYDGSTTWSLVGAETEFDTDNDGNTNEYLCKVIRSFKNHLFALSITEDVGATPTTTVYPQMVHWSHPADAGTVPTTWDYNDATHDAGRAVLTETRGEVLDLLPLGDIAIIYKEDAIYRCSYVGGQSIFDFDLITTQYGLWATNCVVDIGGRHVCLGDGVVYTHSGGQIQNILEGRAANDLFNEIDETNFKKTFLYHRKIENEVWICYPQAGETWCSKALIWNYFNNTWHTRALPNCSSIVGGIIITTPNSTWDAESSLEWDDESDLDWSSQSYSPLADTPVAGSQQLMKFEGETTDIPIAQREGIVIEEEDDWFMIRELFPRASGDPFTVMLGYQDSLESPINWGSSQVFTPGTDHKLDERLSGRTFALRITGTGTWKLSSIGIDYDKAGRR